MKRIQTAGLYVLIFFLVFCGGVIFKGLNIGFPSAQANTPDDNSRNDLEINSQNQVDDLFYAQNDTHYQNYSRITEWDVDNLNEICEMVVQGNVTFLATEDGFFIYNITDRVFPTLISKSLITHHFTQLHIDGDFAYLYSYYQSSLVVFNISDLTNPIQIHIEYLFQIQDIYVENGIVFTSQDRDFEGLKIYDFQDIENIVDLGEYSTNDYLLTKLTKKGDYLFCLTNDQSWQIFDVSELENPALHSTHSSTYDLDDFYIKGNYLYLFDYYSLQIANIEDINNIYYYVGGTINFSGGRAFAIHNNYAYVVVRIGSFLFINMYNITDPLDITLLKMHDNVMPNYMLGYTSMYFEGELAVISTYTYGFRIVNVSDPMNLSVISKVFGGPVYGISVEENYALIEIRSKGFLLLNTTDILNPELIERVFIFGMTSHVFLIDNLSYCSVSYRGLVIHNLTDLNNPQIIGECSLVSGEKIIVQAGFAFLGSFSHISIVNVSNPFAPFKIGEYGVDEIVDFSIHEKLLVITYLAGTGNHRLDLVNISNPLTPILITGLDTNRIFYDIATNGTFVFAAHTYSSNISIYNIENVTSPFHVLDYTTNLFIIKELFIIENLLYIVSYTEGLTIYELDSLLTLPLYGKLYHYAFSFGMRDLISDYLFPNFYLAAFGRIYVCGIDSDKDFLADYLEIEEYGTDPFDSDSDDDLIWDWYEVYNNLDPLNASDALLDYDNDTLTNYEEFLVDSDPWLADTDSDLLTDDLEVLNNTDPNDPDTDNDELTDFEEVMIYFTDPLDADTDDDRLFDGYEVSVYGTDPLKNDTDDDLMDDWFEVYYSLNPLVDDASSDLDIDGLTNLEEYNLGTDPTSSDSDWDGYTDLEEIESGTDPLDSSDFPDYPIYPSPTILTPLPWFASTIFALFVLTICARYLIRKRKKHLRRNN